MTQNKLTLGITGSTGSGKTTVSRILEELGAYVISADIVAREALAPNSPLLDQIRKEFGEEVFEKNDIINRRRLGEVVFSDEAKLKMLNAITHPYIIRRMLDIRVAAFESGEKIVVFDAPLLFEANLDEHCDEIWVVTAPYEQRLTRIMQRDGLDYEQAKKRADARVADSELIKRADVVIENAITQSELNISVRELFDKLLKRE